MKIIHNSKNHESGKILIWLLPILIIQSIVIVILVLHMAENETNQKPEEKETVTVMTPVVSVQKNDTGIPSSNVQETISPVESNNSPEVSNEVEVSTTTAQTTNENANTPKDPTKANPLPSHPKEPNSGRAPQAIRAVDQTKRPVDKNAPAIPVVEKEIQSNQKVVAEAKKTKVVEQPKQVAVTTPKPTPDKKVVSQPAKTTPEPKVVTQPVEAAPVDFVIPEIKDDTGAFVSRNNLGRNEAIAQGNATVKTETAVDMAIAWLAIHQESDGHWDSGKYEGTTSLEFDKAVTGAALLAFISAGQTDTKGEWSTSVKSGLNWLIKAQNKNGSWDPRNYTNAICTMAVTEAAAMGVGGEEVKKSAVLAVDYILKQQNESGCFDYTGKTARDDMSVTGWCVTALKSGALAGIKRKEIGEAYDKLRVFLDKTEGTMDVTPTSKGLGWYTPTTVGSGVAGGACQSIAMFVSQQIGRETVEPTPWLLAAADGQIAKIPTKYANTNVYRVYYTYLTLRQLGGDHWLAWNEPVSNMIINAQRLDGDFRGSWDKNNSSIEKAGRVMYTAFLCLCLEIYYRYPTAF